jgi:hypothetical protein
MWPTATSTDAKSSGSSGYSTESGRHAGTTLTDALRNWSTPNARDWKGEDIPGRNGSPSLPAQVMRRAGNDGSPQEARPRLNPDFVEALMGFPRGWTAYAALEMESCRPKRLGPSESCVSA